MPFDGVQLDGRDLMLRKLDHVTDLLRTQDRWCKGRLKSTDGRRCILGALNDADARSLLTVPILEAVRELTGRSYSRIDHFNDHPATEHRLVLAVLDRAREDVLLGKVTPVRTATTERRVRAFYAAVGRLGG